MVAGSPNPADPRRHRLRCDSTRRSPALRHWRFAFSRIMSESRRLDGRGRDGGIAFARSILALLLLALPAFAAEVPDLPREFRGAWVASVYNLNWPSRR